MNPDQKRHWLSQLDTSLSRREEAIESTRAARNSADSPMTSRYDTQRDLFNNDLNMLMNTQESERALMKEIGEAEECSEVKSGAVVNVELFDGEETLLYMNNHGKLDDIQIVTPRSPLGQAIKGMKPGESTSYRVNNRDFPVRIKDIE